MATMTKAQKDARRRIETIYREIGNGVQVDMMDIPSIFRTGEGAIENGATDEELREALLVLLAEIRKN